MTYQERLKRFEIELCALRSKPLTSEEYQEAIKKLAEKWRV